MQPALILRSAPLLLVAALASACESTSTDSGSTTPAITEQGSDATATSASGGETVEAGAPRPSQAFAKEGFVVYEADARLWIFREGSSELEEFLSIGEPAKHVIKVAAGPGGRTVKAPDEDTILAYMAARDGFFTHVVDGRIWVIDAADTQSISDLQTNGEPAKHIIRPAVGPLGATIKSIDAETVDAYLFAKPGFTVVPVDGRLWIFREGSESLAEYEASGEPAKHVIRPGAGPGGRTVKAVDNDVVASYMAACEGFVTEVVDGRIWVFLPDSEALAEYRFAGEPAKSVTLVGAGPLGMTVRAVDREVADAYLRTVGS